MSNKTEWSRSFLNAAAFVILGFASTASSAQSLGDLADAQRLKQQSEIAKMRREAALVEQELSVPLPPVAPAQLSPEEAQRAARKAAADAVPRIVVHALYSKDGAWIAELAQGQRLSLALVGMQLNGHRILKVDQRGVELSKPCTAQDVREKARCGSRVVALGESV